jgi:hypothetical protein
VRHFSTMTFKARPAGGSATTERLGTGPPHTSWWSGQGVAVGVHASANGRHPGALIYVEPAHFLL